MTLFVHKLAIALHWDMVNLLILQYTRDVEVCTKSYK